MLGESEEAAEDAYVGIFDGAVHLWVDGCRWGFKIDLMASPWAYCPLCGRKLDLVGDLVQEPPHVAA